MQISWSSFWPKKLDERKLKIFNVIFYLLYLNMRIILQWLSHTLELEKKTVFVMFVVAPTKKTFPQYARYSKLIVLQVKCNETKIETFYSTQISTLFCILFIKRTGNLLSYYYLEKIFLLNKYRHSYLFCFFFNRVPFLLLHELFKMETTFNLLFVCR